MRFSVWLCIIILGLSAIPDAFSQSKAEEFKKKHQKVREASATKLIQLIRWCEKEQLFKEGKELVEKTIELSPEHIELKVIQEKGALDIEPDESHRNKYEKNLIEFRKKLRKVMMEVVKDYDALITWAEKNKLLDEARLATDESDKLCTGAEELDPPPPPKKVTLKGMEGDFDQIQSRYFTIITNLDKDEQLAIVQAANDLYEAFVSFFEPYIKDIGKKKLPALKMYYFQTEDQLVRYCQSRGISVVSRYGFASGQESYFRVDRELFGLTGVIYHEGAHQLAGFLVGSPYSSNWMVEALASYFESIERKGLRIYHGRRTDIWSFNGPTKYFDLDEFCNFDRTRWDKEIQSSGTYNPVYGQAAALFRFFFFTENGKYKDKFMKEVVIGGKSSTKQLCQIFGFRSLKEIEKSFKEFANTLYQEKVK